MRNGRFELFTYDGRLAGDIFAHDAHEATRLGGATYAKVWDRTGSDGRPVSAGRKEVK